ncbi:MAG: type II secretion system F family protein, partial [Alphaproteobacteria bacterium]|nr:type II secretion system F family protein [Alphaproteobacteria bacterium]
FAQLVPNREVVEEELRRAGQNWTPEAFAGGILAGAVFLAIALSLCGVSIAIALIFGCIVALGMGLGLVRIMKARRVRKFMEGFPVAIDLMARGIKSGLPISQTIEVIATELEGPVRDEFQSVSDAVRIGRTLDEALAQVGERIAVPEFQFFCISISVQRETGGNIGETLSNLSDVLRKRGQMKLKVKAISSEARTTSIFMSMLPFMIVAAIEATNPTYLAPFLKDAELKHVGIGAFCWMMMGVAVLIKMANPKI